jgi:dTDP-4-amino-4,6-dideoxygalactose transaminase
MPVSNSIGTIAAIPLVDLRASHAEVNEEIRAGLDRALEDAAFIKGEEVEGFEREYASFTGVRHCVGVANGTDALELALRAAGVPTGSEVLLPANTFVATAEAVVRAGARPVLADVDPDCLLLTADSLSDAGPGLAAVMPVHLYGQMAPMTSIVAAARQRSVLVIEDAAQAHGATQDGSPAGSFGLMAGVSFYPGKNLGAYGDAGAVLTQSPEMARSIRLLGDHGSERKYEHLSVGFNSRLDALQALVLRVRLRRLAQWNAARREAALRYEELLSGLDEISLPKTLPGNEHVWHLYVIRVPQRDRILQDLDENGVRAAIHYPVPVHLQPAFRYLGYAPGDFPVAEAAAGQILSLPLYPQITLEQQQRVAQAIRSALRDRP